MNKRECVDAINFSLNYKVGRANYIYPAIMSDMGLVQT